VIFTHLVGDLHSWDQDRAQRLVIDEVQYACVPSAGSTRTTPRIGTRRWSPSKAPKNALDRFAIVSFAELRIA